MSNILGYALAISLAAVTAWDSNPFTSGGGEATRSQCTSIQDVDPSFHTPLDRLTHELTLTSGQVSQVESIIEECRYSCPTQALTHLVTGLECILTPEQAIVFKLRPFDLIGDGKRLLDRAY